MKVGLFLFIVATLRTPSKPLTTCPMDIFIVAIVTFAINLLLGRWRVRYRKFSPMWWVLIHASIPIVIPLRIGLGVPLWTIPVFITLGVVGQALGARLRW